MKLYREVLVSERLPNEVKDYCILYNGTYFRACYIKDKNKWFVDDPLKTYIGEIQPTSWLESIEVELDKPELIHFENPDTGIEYYEKESVLEVIKDLEYEILKLEYNNEFTKDLIIEELNQRIEELEGLIDTFLDKTDADERYDLALQKIKFDQNLELDEQMQEIIKLAAYGI